MTRTGPIYLNLGARSPRPFWLGPKVIPIIEVISDPVLKEMIKVATDLYNENRTTAAYVACAEIQSRLSELTD